MPMVATKPKARVMSADRRIFLRTCIKNTEKPLAQVKQKYQPVFKPWYFWKGGWGKFFPHGVNFEFNFSGPYFALFSGNGAFCNFCAEWLQSKYLTNIQDFDFGGSVFKWIKSYRPNCVG